VFVCREFKHECNCLYCNIIQNDGREREEIVWQKMRARDRSWSGLLGYEFEFLQVSNRMMVTCMVGRGWAWVKMEE
jgi:hypothetical protein